MKCKLCEESFDTKYRIPRNLYCGHCFCEQCLKIYQQNDEILCPRCAKKSPSKLPICYALLEIIDSEDQYKKNDYCLIHTLEKIQFLCKNENENICAVCLLNNHNGHIVSSIKENTIINEIKKDFERPYISMIEKYNFLKNMKAEVEKCEEFLNKMNEKQKLKVNEIIGCFSNKKREKLEELNKFVDLNYLNQQEMMNMLILETEYKINYIDIYSTKIQELLQSMNDQKNVSEFANFNITKTEDEFRKIRGELETMKNNISDLKISELYFEFNPKKLLKEELVKYDIGSHLSNNYKKEKYNHIIFFGDSKDKLILCYSLEKDTWSTMGYNFIDNTWEFLDYSSVSTFSNGDLLISGGCHYTDYRSSAKKSTYIAKIISDNVNIYTFKPLIVDRFSHGSLVIKDIPYVFGGHDGSDTLSSLEYFDYIENKWKFLSCMNIEREIFAYCSVKQRYIYVFGGFNINHLDTIERYDVVYDNWKLLNYKMKRPLQNATAVEIENSKIVLVGGYNGALHKCVDVLDLETKNWISLDYMQIPRRKSHCYKYKNKLLIFGGESAESETHTPEIYDFNTKAWGELKSYDYIVSRSLNFWCSTGIFLNN